MRQPASVSPPSVCLDKNRPYLPPAKLFTVSQLECSGCNLPGASPGPNCVWCLISGLLIKRNIPSRISLWNCRRLFYWFVGFTEETSIKTETKLTSNTQHVLARFSGSLTIDDNNMWHATFTTFKIKVFPARPDQKTDREARRWKQFITAATSSGRSDYYCSKGGSPVSSLKSDRERGGRAGWSGSTICDADAFITWVISTWTTLFSVFR